MKAYFYLNDKLYGAAGLTDYYQGRRGNGAVKIGNAFDINSNGKKMLSED